MREVRKVNMKPHNFTQFLGQSRDVIIDAIKSGIHRLINPHLIDFYSFLCVFLSGITVSVALNILTGQTILSHSRAKIAFFLFLIAAFCIAVIGWNFADINRQWEKEHAHPVELPRYIRDRQLVLIPCFFIFLGATIGVLYFLVW